MKLPNIETVLKDAERAWLIHCDKFHPKDDPSYERYRLSYILGWLQSSYQQIYYHIPEEMKEETIEPVNAK